MTSAARTRSSSAAYGRCSGASSRWRSRSPSAAGWSTSRSTHPHTPTTGASRCSFSPSSRDSASAGRKTRSLRSCRQSRTPRRPQARLRALQLLRLTTGRTLRKEQVMSDTAVAVGSDAPTGLAVRTQKRYGWRPDHPDMRDYLAAVEPLKTLPREVSLRDQMPPIYDQGQLGSCTANSIGAILEFNQLKQEAKDATTPSRLFIYYNERAMEGTVDQDSGAEIRDGIKSVAQLGAPPETDWPYEINEFAAKPPTQAYEDGLKHQAIRYARVPQTQMGIQNVLASGYPISFGFTVYESFEKDVGSDGIVPMPQPDETVIGGHAVVAIGYKPIQRQLYFECRNSWGNDWADHGHFWMPGDYGTATTSRRRSCANRREAPRGRGLRGRRREGDRVRRGDRGRRARRRRPGVGEPRRHLGRLDRRRVARGGLRRHGHPEAPRRCEVLPLRRHRPGRGLGRRTVQCGRPAPRGRAGPLLPRVDG